MSVINDSLEAVRSVIANDCSDETSMPSPTSASDSANEETVALEAVKLDPAVLEAQVTLDIADLMENTSISGAASSKGSDGGVSPPVGIRGEGLWASPAREIYRSASSASVSSGASSCSESEYERVLSAQQAALDAISPQQLDLLLRYVDTLRRQRNALQKTLECGFCKGKGAPHTWYKMHSMKDWHGNVVCPVLRAYRGQWGASAGTNQVCSTGRQIRRH